MGVTPGNDMSFGTYRHFKRRASLCERFTGLAEGSQTVRLAHSRLSLRRSRRHAASLGRDLRIKGRNGVWNIGGTHPVPVRSGGPCGAPRGAKRWRSEWRRTGLPHFRAASRNRRAGRMLPRDLCQSFGGMQQAQRVGGPPSALQGVTNVLLKIFPAFCEPRGRLLVRTTNFIRPLQPTQPRQATFPLSVYAHHRISPGGDRVSRRHRAARPPLRASRRSERRRAEDHLREQLNLNRRPRPAGCRG
jgi:hypothetical protein